MVFRDIRSLPGRGQESAFTGGWAGGLFSDVSFTGYTEHGAGKTGQGDPKTTPSFPSFFASVRNRGDVSMRGSGRGLKGSFTVEAAWVMAMVLLSLSVMIQQAFRIHDQTVAAMCLHEAAEKGRHGTGQKVKAAETEVEEHIGRLMSFPSCDLELEIKGKKVYGKCRGGKWSRDIEVHRFRPETFLRKITLIEGLGGENGN